MSDGFSKTVRAPSEQTIEDWIRRASRIDARAELAELRSIAAARDAEIANALGFVEQTIYANEDNATGVTWRNCEVLALLRDIRATLTDSEAPSD